MSIEFILRVIGMIVFSAIGASFGANIAESLTLSPESSSLLFMMIGALIGLVATPWATTRPAEAARSFILNIRAETLVTSMVGFLFGIITAGLLAWPLSLLPDPWGQYSPSVGALALSYISIIIFALRAQDIFQLLRQLLQGQRFSAISTNAEALLDTSVIIDGRILDLSSTGFINYKLLIPQFVIRELQSLADSNDTLLRQRGRHGLDILNKLKNQSQSPIEVIDDHPEEGSGVDEKLVYLAVARGSIPIMTNDIPLNKVAGLQDVPILNINELALALRPVYLPGEIISLHIIQEGREEDQGVGYLIDGTMVVVEGGKQFRDRTINARITRYILGQAGKMYFAHPEVRASR